jgi:HEPN domain-containing protein
MNDLDLVREWFRFAGNELFTAKHLCYDLYPPQIEIACYLCQQAAEKALKGCLIHFTQEEPEYTHNLKTLCNQCIALDGTFDSILTYCGDLTEFVVAGRYPDELPIDEPTAKSAVRKADAVYTFCLSKIPELQQPPP